ncbi:hypothetical protein [Xanthomonas sp. LMG 12461]|uniref:hypothetical protein n=1 Tax=Xanthomonas sp. LMG 12461 TaxID=2014543 RepID=UPI0012646A0C|nr:hypothetical protein [Xanthomonas sp. LMG 12461]KAB7768907.1 hypothetical protein CEK68_04785 [Xanthomonas sp. LMG 12461]
MDIKQHAAIQPLVMDLQRSALAFAELGESKVSRLILAAAFAAHKIKPTKPVPPSGQPVSEAPKPVAKGKGA